MRPQINALTATRSFAAIMVFIFHFGQDTFPFYYLPNIFRTGNIAVSYFFVLSGFVLYITYSDRNFTYWYYLKRRLGRIAPVYILALILFIFIALFFYNMTFARILPQIIACAFFAQAYIPDYALSLNTAAWSLSVEMFFYLLFPFLLFLQKKNGNRFLALAVFMYLLTQVVFLLGFKVNGSSTQWNFFQYDPIFHINQFMVGMVGGYLYMKMKPGNKKYKYIPLAMLVIILLLFQFRPANLFYDVGLIAPVFMIFILFVAINNPKFLNFKPLVFLGEISYGIYILQFPVREWLWGMTTRYFHIPNKYFFYFAITLLILAASTSYYFIETPLRNLINGKRKRASA